MMVNDGYPLVNVYITMERSTIFNGKTHYFSMVIFNSYVSLPEGTNPNGYSTGIPWEFALEFALGIPLDFFYHWNLHFIE